MTLPLTVGYAAMLEQFGPRDAVDLSTHAEQHGFSGVMASDHFQPWVPRQGQSPFVWNVLAAIGERPGESVRTEYRIRHKDGSWRVFEAEGRTIAADTSDDGIIAIARDVTDRKAAEPLMILLRRFATESARDEARMFCEELVADEAFVPAPRDLIAA